MILLIGISGKKRVGKDTVASFMQSIYKCPTKIIGFADPLKDEVAQGCQVSYSYIEKNKQVFRTILQWWGTDFRRKLHSEDYWIKKMDDLLRDYEHNYDVVIIKDVRFLNEAEYIKSKGGFLIRVNRMQGNEPCDTHQSEIELDTYRHFDFIINNTSDLTSLKLSTIKVMQQINQQLKSCNYV